MQDPIAHSKHAYWKKPDYCTIYFSVKSVKCIWCGVKLNVNKLPYVFSLGISSGWRMCPLEFYMVWHFIVTLTRDIWGKSMHTAFSGLTHFLRWGLLHTCSKCHCVVYSQQYLQVSDDVRKVGFSVKTGRAREREREGGKKHLPEGWLYLQAIDFPVYACVCVCVCVWGEGSSKCVNPFFLVAVAGPPSCFSPHIITILLLLHPLVTRPCTHSPTNPLVCLQRASRFYEQSGHARTHTHTHTRSPCAQPHTLTGMHAALPICPYFAGCNL